MYYAEVKSSSVLITIELVLITLVIDPIVYPDAYLWLRLLNLGLFIGFIVPIFMLIHYSIACILTRRSDERRNLIDYEPLLDTVKCPVLVLEQQKDGKNLDLIHGNSTAHLMFEKYAQ